MRSISDDLDRAIVRLLEEDGRLANLEIARCLGVSEATVRRRISRLMRQSGLRIVASLDGAPRTTEMLFLIHTEAGCRITVAERLAALPDVQQVSLTTGGHDIAVRAAFRADADALDFLVQQLEGAEGVRSVQVSHVLKNLLPLAAIARLPASDSDAPARQAALDAFVLEAARASNITAVLELGCDTALRGLGADRAAIFLLDAGGQPTHRASRGLSADYLRGIERRISPRIGIGIRVVNTHVHVYVEDAHTSPLLAGVQDLVQGEGYRSLLFLPLLYGETLIGTFSLYNDTIRRYSDDELARAQAFADQLTLAIVRTGGRVASPVESVTVHAEGASSPLELLLGRLAGYSE